MLRLSTIGVLLLATLTGCGTMENFKRESLTDATVYGGVGIALDRFKPSPGVKNCGMPTLPFYPIDVAASAVADTLTLPVTVPLAGWRAGQSLWTFYHAEAPDPTEQSAWRRFWFNDPPAP